MENKDKREKLYIGKAKGPINIALIKYWGKEDEQLITPLNNSISLTLDINTFYTETIVIIQPLDKKEDNNNEKNENIISLKINEKTASVNSRIKNIFDKILNLKNPICEELSKKILNIQIESYNTFPIASGCASSASSMAALVVAIISALKIDNISKMDITKIARIGSGSACRSIFGGICEWIKEGGDESHAIQLYDENYWDLGIKLIIVNQNKKEISSSLGMKITKETSELFKYRINNIVDSHLLKLKNSLKNKDFNGLAEIIIKDSNNFHACCRDSYPTINYLNEESEYIIKSVILLNNIYENNICAYTFDAGSNAFIIYERKNQTIIDDYFNFMLGFSDNNIDELTINFGNKNSGKIKEDINTLALKKPIKEKILKQIDFKLGEGTKILDVL
jgi:diphosphomevalonate decarboxylase